MRRCAAVGIVLALLVPAVFLQGQSKDQPKWAPSPHIAASAPLRPEAQLKKFRLPPGFEVQLVAADPDIRKPINIAFDAAGRLWVTETVEYPFPAADGKGRDAVKILEDFGPDGRARKITTFAGGLNIPIGVLPLTPRDALVYSIPSIWRLRDTNGGGRADERIALYGPYGHKDTHGMTGEFTYGFDGWVYACHGFSNTSTVKSRGDTAITMTSGNTYRMQIDGSRIEYFTHGQVNPFGLSFDPRGNLYSCDCHTQPIYQLLRGAYYPSFGRPDDGLGFGPEMITSYPESTAIAGITYYAADQYPAAFRDCAFIGDVVTNRVNQFRITWTGSSPKATLERFLQSDDPWFRPCDVKLGPDGCLYVADFYNRIIGHYEVPLTHPGRDRDKGRIWRIVYRGADGQGGPRPWQDLTKLDVAGLTKELDNPNLAVRLQATHELVRHGEVAAGPARLAFYEGSDFQKVHALWVLHRLNMLDHDMLAQACRERSAMVRVHGQRVLTERGALGAAQRDLVLAGLKDADPLVQRCAAEALGAHPAADNVAPLLELRHRVPAGDTHLLYAVRMALRDQLRPAETWKKLDVAKLSEADQRAIADVCPGVHNAPSGAFLLHFLENTAVPPDQFRHYLHTAVRYAQLPEASGDLAAGLIARRFPKDLVTEANLLKTIRQAWQERGGGGPGWIESGMAGSVVRDLLQSSDPRHLEAAIELAGLYRRTEAQPQMLALARSPKAPEPLRKSAVNTAFALDPAAAVKALRAVLLNDKEDLGVRQQVAAALAGTNRPEAHAALVQALETAPAALQSVIALGMAGSPQGGEKLLDAVAKGKASPRLLQDRAVELKLRQAHVADLDGRLARLTKGLPPADQRIAALIAQRRDGFLAAKADAAEGAKVFAKQCAVCHQLGGQGAKVGPQLDGVGIRGPERLLEDILDPNRNVDQAFRSTTLVLDSGQFVSGLVLREEGAVIVLADAQGKEQRVPKAAVEQRIVSQLSPMPSNFAEQLSEPELYNLLAYLLAQRAKE